MADEESIPEGFCQCGCGERTKIAIRSHSKFGWVRGQPFQFVHGHNRRRYQPRVHTGGVHLCECGCGRETSIAKKTDLETGYIKGQPKRFVKGHRPQLALTYPRKSYAEQGSGQMKMDVHRLRAELAIGKPLPPGVQVHHPDEDPGNPQARLVICQDAAYHALLHVRMRIVRAGGNPNTDRICSACHRVKPMAMFSPIRSSATDFYRICRECQSLKQRRRYWTKRQSASEPVS